jgi:hypothetical protein
MTDNEHHIIEQDKLHTKIYLMLIPWNIALISAIIFGYGFLHAYDEYTHYGYASDADPVPHITKLSDVCFYGVSTAVSVIAVLLIIVLWIKFIRKTERKTKSAIYLILAFLSEIAVFATVFFY